MLLVGRVAADVRLSPDRKPLRPVADDSYIKTNHADNVSKQTQIISIQYIYTVTICLNTAEYITSKHTKILQRFT